VYRDGVSADPVHDRLLAITLTLPGAYEDRPWGSVHCKVAGKIFIGWGRNKDGAMEMGFRTTRELQGMLVASDPRFRVAKYSGSYGGTDMVLGPRPNWDEIEQFIVESYRLVAPKKFVKDLDAKLGADADAKKPATKKPAAKKPATTKPATKKPAKKPATKPATKKRATKTPARAKKR
jgi:predicted DNA-binding protein (MmcQ/YjbR family)